MKCDKCNFENNDSAKFCSECGNPLKRQESKYYGEPKLDGYQFASEMNDFKTESFEGSSPKASKSPKNKKTLMAAIVVILIVASVITLVVSSRCNHEFGDTKCGEIPVCVVCSKSVGKPLEHDWTPANCTEPKTCKTCGEIDGDSLGHDWQEATCQTPKTCRRCGKTAGKAVAHECDNWNIIKKATCTQNGKREGYCNLCKQTVTETVPETEHKPGKWETEKKATIKSDGKRVKRCTVCNEVVKEESIKITEEEYKNECQSYSYSTIARNPNKYKVEYGKFTGEVIQVIEDDLYGVFVSYTLRVALNGDYGNIILVTYVATSNEDHILEDDRINLYGEIQGSYTYESTMGASITVPYVEAKYIDIL